MYRIVGSALNATAFRGDSEVDMAGEIGQREVLICKVTSMGSVHYYARTGLGGGHHV